MVDILNNKIEEGDEVLFPGGRELMKGKVIKIRQKGRAYSDTSFEAFVENESGYRKWKDSIAIVKIRKEEK